MKKIAALLCVSLSMTAWTQIEMNYETIDQTEFVKDLVKQELIGKEFITALWMPNEYWEYSFNVTYAGQVDGDFSNVLKEFLGERSMFFIADHRMEGGEMTYLTEKELASRLRLQYKGKQYAPVSNRHLSQEDEYLMEVLHNGFAGALGQFGEGAHIFFFDVDGEDCISALEEGSFEIIVKDVHLTYALPLPSLLPPKFCPVDQEAWNGSWNYCPVHGKELEK